MIGIIAPGGFGNQLFIWALAHKIAQETGHKVIIFYTFDKQSNPNNAMYLNLLKKYCNHEISVKKSNLIAVYLKFYDKLRSIGLGDNFMVRYIFKTVGSDESLLFGSKRTPSFTLIRGYFQNYGLVNSVWNVISFEIAELLSLIQLPDLKLDAKSPLQVIHIRRGDYLLAKEEFGLLTLEYFKRNIDFTQQTVICTDEEEKVEIFRRTLGVNRIFTSKEMGTLQSFKLMTLSNTLILSNSTFSWWAGFFVTRDGGNVISPWPWFINEKINYVGLYNPEFKFSFAEFYKGDSIV